MLHHAVMRIRGFGVEIWMNRWETTCRYNLAETCVESITVDALLGLAGMDADAFLAEILPMRLTYGAIAGTDRLRSAIAALYDTVGTGMMLDFAGGMTLDVHGISGLVAIVLMLIHATWATIVLLRRDERWIVEFHRFSIAVWLIWLIPYFSPMFFAMAT